MSRKNEPDYAISETEAAKLMNVSRRSVQYAGRVLRKGIPELIEQVGRGNLAVSTASLIAELPKQQQAKIVAKGKKEILATARSMRAEKRLKSNSDAGVLLVSAKTEKTIESVADALSEVERNVLFTSGIRFRDNLDRWLKILEKKGAIEIK
jgi:hypothetical protein